jgi:hypothetical protein
MPGGASRRRASCRQGGTKCDDGAGRRSADGKRQRERRASDAEADKVGRWLPTYTHQVWGESCPGPESLKSQSAWVARKGLPQRAVSKGPHARFSGGPGDSKRPEA